eukprot:4062391-Prymnesium_polylepis.1
MQRELALHLIASPRPQPGDVIAEGFAGGSEVASTQSIVYPLNSPLVPPLPEPSKQVTPSPFVPQVACQTSMDPASLRFFERSLEGQFFSQTLVGLFADKSYLFAILVSLIVMATSIAIRTWVRCRLSADWLSYELVSSVLVGAGLAFEVHAIYHMVLALPHTLLLRSKAAGSFEMVLVGSSA